MIVYYLGIPGSGKSYSGVNTIYDNFSTNKDAKKDLKKSYNNCYTNINEFKFDLVKNVFNFDFDVFTKQISILHDMYKDKKSDSELIEKAIEFKIFKTLFILDECHQFLDVERKILVWWLTYHRHLHHDIYLITQSLSLVNSKYKPLAESFYRAKSSSLTFNGSYFNYVWFTDSRLTQGSKVGVKKVKKRKEVFELYKSGDSVESKNIIKKFIIISLIFAVILFAIGYLFFYSKNQEIKKETKSFNIEKNVIQSRQIFNDTKTISHDEEIMDYSEQKFFILNCTFSICSNDDIEFPLMLYSKFEKQGLIKVLFREVKSSSLINYYLSASNDFYNFLSIKNKSEVYNDEEHTHIDLFNSDSSSK